MKTRNLIIVAALTLDALHFFINFRTTLPRQGQGATTFSNGTVVLKDGTDKTFPEIVKEAEALINATADDLEKLSVRFYIYDHPNITLSNEVFKPAYHTGWRRYHYEMENDEQMIRALEKSQSRTTNSDDADIFIPPIPLRRIVTSQYRLVSGAIHLAMGTLVNHDLFRKHQGNNHVLVNTAYILFRSDRVKNFPCMRRWYPHFYNITTILSWDPSATYNDLHDSNSTNNWNEFREPMIGLRPMTKRSASLGLATKNEDMQLVPASMEKFHNSSNFIFYHSTTATSFNNSTIFRHAPITNITQATFPKSSIGWGLEKERWLHEYQNSKFCLMIRGDSPHSHALWRSIRSGCIPVIAADILPIFSPILKSTLNMSDYGVLVSEIDLVNNPKKTLLKLNDMSEAEIEVKVKHLAFAQRVIFTDHPESLFVPAFLKESMMASEVKWKDGLAKLK